jgi:hypothetical protein
MSIKRVTHCIVRNWLATRLDNGRVVTLPLIDLELPKSERKKIAEKEAKKLLELHTTPPNLEL